MRTRSTNGTCLPPADVGTGVADHAARLKERDV
jgi:hypothetical protein